MEVVKVGDAITCRETGDTFVISEIDAGEVSYNGPTAIGLCSLDRLDELFTVRPQ